MTDSATEDSWILEIRNRLGTPPPRRSKTQGAAHAAFVPIYVDAGALWVLLSETDRALALDWGTVAFPGAGLETGEEPWELIKRICEEETGAGPDKVLRLGELDEVDTLHGFSVVPCVGAIPPPGEEVLRSALEVVPLPLIAFQDSRLIEDRSVSVDGNEGWIRVYHVGKRRVAGTAAQILEALTQRLQAEPLLAP